MTTLRKGDPLYDAVFAGVTLLPFESKGPNYNLIVNGFLDPSNRTLLLNEDVMNANQAYDIRSGMQQVVNTLAVATQSDVSPNFPSVLIPAMRSLLTSEDISLTLSSGKVASVFDAAASGNPIGTAGAVLGVGMAAVGIAVPVVGTIAAAIIGLASGIYSLFKMQQNKLKQENKEHRAMLYRSFPPLQVADAEMDGAIVNSQLLPTLQNRDWTRIFQPRFTSSSWVGLEREGGYAFAPGQSAQNVEGDGFGAFDVFTPSTSGGLGVIPGTNQVTSVVQVSLPHDPEDIGNSAWQSFIKGGPDPRGIGTDGIYGWTRVHDTGMYYPATGRLAASVWSMALAKGSPFKYRIDAKKLHDEWERWASSGIDYIRDVCYPWWRSVSGPAGKIPVNKTTNFEGFFGTSIFNSVGAWTGVVDQKKSTTLKQVYNALVAPDGITGPELVAAKYGYGMVGSSVSSTYSGGFLPILDPDNWPDQYMGTIYDRRINIKGTLDNLQAQQRYDLKHTLVCASVSVNDAAFKGDSKLLDLLLTMRTKLLTSEDRFYVDLSDVTDDEPGLKDRKNSDSWKKQLAAVGVTDDPKKMKGPLRLAPSNEPPPGKPPFHGALPNPWDPRDISKIGMPTGGSGSGGGLALALGAAGITGAALIAAHYLRGKKRRSFSAGRAR